ncbi:MAG: ABC transporter permease [Actinomycetota bacterium]|nr:ABC transporter permease [Actinomycetota bacterium]MDH5223449.1 ABC transporter permease [Actinomycetota bacterium]MDH5313657.1 ABC transporter permease [Actinomycetota bacterium]
MGRYLIRRTLFLILVLFIVSLLTFLIFVKLPAADPARRATGRSTTPEQVEAAREAFGLDKPLYVQYGRFAKGLIPLPGFFLNEDVYYSYGNFIAVKEEIYRRLPVTITLTIGAAVIWLAMGIPIGIISGVRKGSIWDRAGMVFALIGVSMPVFWLGQLLLYFFWFQLGWAPPSGLQIGASIWESIAEGKFILPWITLAFTSAAFYARMVRGNLIETMSEDYIRTARSKGLAERRVIYKHGLRGALTPVVTMLGLDIGLLLGGAFITETLFGLPGIGELAVKSINNNDFPMVMGVTVLGALFIAVANLVVDVVYAFLDPRVRYT